MNGDQHRFFAESEIEQLRRTIAVGDLIVFPTDTVYGLATNPLTKRAAEHLLEVKGRDEKMPPPVLGATADQLLQMGHFATAQQGRMVERIAQAFWPGPLTLIIPTESQFGWDTAAVGNTVAVRVPDQDIAHAILALTGPLAVTSANKTGQAPATTIGEARGYFGDEVTLYFDGGSAASEAPSTILDCSGSELQIVREGAIGWDQIANIV